MTRTIRIVIVGTIITDDLDVFEYFDFLKKARSIIEGRIKDIPEFQEKNKEVEVAFSMKKDTGEAIQDGKNVIYIDVLKVIKKEENSVKIRELLVDAVVDAVQKELPNIQAFPKLEHELKTANRKPWYKLW